MENDSSDAVLRRLQSAIEANKTIPFHTDRPDTQVPSVNWSVYGLIDTNEIVVVAHHSTRTFAKAGSSPLIYPLMADRLFGMDVEDHAYAHELSNELWPVVEKYLEGIG